VVSVVKEYGADPTGKTDSTQALQNAIDAARTQNVTLFLPLGCYTITDKLNATESRDGRWQPVVIVGEQTKSLLRPALVLPPSTPLFGDSQSLRPLIRFQTDWCLAAGAAKKGIPAGCNADGAWCPKQGAACFKSFPPYNFNQVLQGIDIYLGGGNPGAVGVDMLGAQGATLQEVAIYAAPDAAACIVGGNGGGGSFVGITAVGAKYGIDGRVVQGTPAYVAMTLENQSCAAILYTGRKPMTATGVRIKGSPRLAGVIAGVDPEVFGVSDCNIGKSPAYDGVGIGISAGELTGFSSSSGWNPASHTLAEHADMVDSIIELDYDGNETILGQARGTRAPCIIANSSLWLSDLFIAGCAGVVTSRGKLVAKAPADGAQFAHISMLAFGRQVNNGTMNNGTMSNGTMSNDGGLGNGTKYESNGSDGVLGNGTKYSYAFPIYSNGSRSEEGVVRFGDGTASDGEDGEWGIEQGNCSELVEVAVPPVGLQRKHIWADESPTWQSLWSSEDTAAVADAVNALEHGVRGDGVTDDWMALQKLLDDHRVVVLPKGFYRLSRTLQLRRAGGSALVGIGRTLSVLMPTSAASPVTAAHAMPLVDVSAAYSTLGFVTILAWDHQPHLFALRWGGTGGLFRQVFQNRLDETRFAPFTAASFAPHRPTQRKPAANISFPFILVEGTGAFYDLNLDFGCCFGTLLPPASVHVNPGIASLSEILHQQSGYRTLLINNSKHSGDGLRFYAHNTEQDVGDAHTEIRYSQNVTLYGAKSEGNYAAIWIRDSDLVTMHGYGGDATPFANSTRYALLNHLFFA
jgi:hypothetical protein